MGPADKYYAIERYKGKAHKLLIKDHDPTAIRGNGRRNHLRAECVGATAHGVAILLFFVNGRYVAEAVDPQGFWSFARIGLSMYSDCGGSIASFDNALAWQHLSTTQP